MLTWIAAACAGGPEASMPDKLTVESEYYSLPNGLKVVLSRDTTVPTVGVGVYYHVGFRNEPKGRTGFAHLFEHLMFQGSANLGKMEFIKLVEGNGGLLNARLRYFDPDRRRAQVELQGEVPSLTRRPPGCEFHTRCPQAFARCRVEEPATRQVGPDHVAACHLNDQAPQPTGGAT